MPTESKLQGRSVEHLRGMCLKIRVAPEGDKATLIKRLIAERPPLGEPAAPVPAASPEPQAEPAEE